MNLHRPIQILLVEDAEADGLLLAANLKAHGLVFNLTRVEELEPLRTELVKPGWDILLTDFDLPGMDGFQVIGEAARLAPGLPCILVSGQIGEEAAVEALRAGAKDFVCKDRLARLYPAIQRELGESLLRARADETREELRTAEDRFRAITSAALDGIVMVDPEGRISFWNQAAERIFGYTEAEALGSDLFDLVGPTRFHAKTRSAFRHFQGTGHGAAIGKVTKLAARRKDGSEFPVEFSLAAIQEDSVWHAVGVVRDITDRKIQEREQFEHLHFLRTLIGTIPSPLYYEDQEGRILGCNRAFEAFLGLPTDAVVGQKSEQLLAGAVEDQADGSEPGFLVRPDAYETSFHMNLPERRVRHALFRKAPFWDADGCPEGYVATLLDITQLKETEAALRRNESLFSAIHSHVVDLVAIIDAEGRRIYTSPSYQFVLGYSEVELLGLSATSLLHPEDLERVSQALRGLLEGHPTQMLEYRLRHKDGHCLPFESTFAIIPDPGGGPIRALVVARDVSERKAAELNQAAMEVQLRQAQKLEAIGQLAAGIAHEINTPTQFIGDNTTFLRDAFKDSFGIIDKLTTSLTALGEGSGPEAAKAKAALAELEAADLGYLREEIPRAIQQSLEGVGRISKIVKAMKDFSHPGGASKTLTNLQQAIESTITVSRNEWKYVANLVTDFDPALPPVPCYPGEFNQVILNLIVNAAHAIEAAREGRESSALGQITVKTRSGEDEVEISVADDGTGIPEAVQARMFEPFYTTKAVGKGSGQGLAIAHAVIVEKHHGRIEVQSEVGHGTTFILHLPLKASGPGEGDA
jgi:two-component system NtrC family sensor kinase